MKIAATLHQNTSKNTSHANKHTHDPIRATRDLPGSLHPMKLKSVLKLHP